MKRWLLIFSILTLIIFTAGCQNQQELSQNSQAPIPQKQLTKWDEIVQKQEIKIGVPSLEDSFDNQLIDAFSKEVDLTVTKVVIAWDDTLSQAINTGQVDLLWGQIPATSDFSSQFRLSSPYFRSTMLYLAKDNDIVPDDNTPIGVMKHSAEAAAIRNYFKNVIEFQSEKALFQSLDNRQTSVIVYNKSLYEHLKMKNESHIIIKEVPYDLVVAFEQNNTSVAEETEKIIAKIKADGTAAEICKIWYPEDLITK